MADLQQRLDEFKRAFESGAPPYNAPHEAIKKMHRATAELKASGIEDRALKVGDRAPSFTLFNQDHEQVASSDLLRGGPLVVSFFRGHW
jgi:AhpC/TSA family